MMYNMTSLRRLIRRPYYYMVTPIVSLFHCIIFSCYLPQAHPKKTMQQLLPEDSDILCTHPMFGPESGKYGWQGLPFIYEKVRIADADR